jgi:hypothetical protein
VVQVLCRQIRLTTTFSPGCPISARTLERESIVRELTGTGRENNDDFIEARTVQYNRFILTQPQQLSSSTRSMYDNNFFFSFFLIWLASCQCIRRMMSLYQRMMSIYQSPMSNRGGTKLFFIIKNDMLPTPPPLCQRFPSCNQIKRQYHGRKKNSFFVLPFNIQSLL